MIIYLHDTPYEIDAPAAANKDNITTVDQVENVLKSTDNVVLTADDGYKSIKNILPLAKKYNCKVIIFVTTGFIDNTVYPYEVVVSNFLEANNSCVYRGKRYFFEKSFDKEAFFKIVHQELKPLSLAKRERIIDNFLFENGLEKEDYRKNVFMDESELVDVSRHPNVEIGSHCVSHLLLTKQSIFNAYKELRVSRLRLKELLGKDISKVSYPYGGNNFIVRALAKIVGYKEGYATKAKRSSKLAKTRFEVSDL